MNEWKMLTLVGQDKPGIVAEISSVLFDAGAQLGEASMMRLGGNFTIMLMVKSEQSIEALEQKILPVAKKLALNVSLQAIEAHLHQHEIPNTRITVYGADRPGIVAQTTTGLLEAGFNIMDLESDVAGDEADPIYIMYIEGIAKEGPEALETAMEQVKMQGVNIDITPIDVMIA